MPALNVNFSDAELEVVRQAAAADSVSLKQFAHVAVLEAVSRRRVADVAPGVAAKSAELNERLARQPQVYYLTAADVSAVLRATGAPAELRDLGLLAAAVARPQASAFGADAYPDPWVKAAALLHSLVRNHPFLDGNKRAGWNSAWTFLEVNELAVLDPDFDVDDAEQLVLAVAAGHLDDLPVIAQRLKRSATS